MVRDRIAPSPTGQDLHIGNAYTALINYAFAKKHQGQFIVRIEDTDRSRFVKGSEEHILSSLDWLGLSADESPKKGGPYAPYRQSERLKLYKELAEELIKKGHAYYCFCTADSLIHMRKQQQAEGLMPKYDRRCLALSPGEITARVLTESFAIRMKIPDGETTFEDIIRGPITIQNNQLDDQVILKSDGYPTYHLGVVVDDYLMEISHVIRGEEWISSTPKHILLYNFFRWKLPKFAHLPLLRGPDKSKLSKRKNPVWVSWYREQGYLPEAIINYLALMGWSYPSGKEIFSLSELITEFTLERVQTVGPVFDLTKLEWMNGEYIRALSKSELKYQLGKFVGSEYSLAIIEKTVPLIQERIKKLSAYLPLCDFFFKRPERYEVSVSKNKKMIQHAIEQFEKIDWKVEYIGNSLKTITENLDIKMAELTMILRVAISGKKITPPLNESMEILGKKESLERLKIFV